MSWDYSLVHTPEYRSNRTLTAIGTEDIVDAFGRTESTHLLRITDDQYDVGETAFRWVSARPICRSDVLVGRPRVLWLLPGGLHGLELHKQRGRGGLLNGQTSDRLHFNRTNIIGVPGHPNGYDDTRIQFQSSTASASQPQRVCLIARTSPSRTMRMACCLGSFGSTQPFKITSRSSIAYPVLIRIQLSMS